jgi:mycofactocin precursor peptide peptidase
MRLANFRSREAGALTMNDLVLIAPLGSFEQRGPHLPLTTDTDIVRAILGAIAAHSLGE